MAVIAVQRNYTYGLTVNLTTMECWSCGVVYAVPTDFDRRRRAEGSHWFCPNGHNTIYTETDLDRAKKRADAAERRATQADETARWQRERAEASERSARSLRGHLTRMRNRIANGVCPVPGCKRTGLVQTMRHIATKHPAWHAEHVDDLNQKGNR